MQDSGSDKGTQKEGELILVGLDSYPVPVTR